MLLGLLVLERGSGVYVHFVKSFPKHQGSGTFYFQYFKIVQTRNILTGSQFLCYSSLQFFLFNKLLESFQCADSHSVPPSIRTQTRGWLAVMSAYARGINTGYLEGQGSHHSEVLTSYGEWGPSLPEMIWQNNWSKNKNRAQNKETSGLILGSDKSFGKVSPWPNKFWAHAALRLLHGVLAWNPALDDPSTEKSKGWRP